MKLFTVFMFLTVTLKGQNGKARNVTAKRRLAVIADDENHAKARAVGWLEHEFHDPRRLEIEFSQGKSRAIAVRIAEAVGDGARLMIISEHEQGAVQL